MNSRQNSFFLIRSQSGSVLIIALIGIVVLGIMAAAAATLAQQGNEQARRESELKALLAFTQNLETVLSTNSSCVGVAGVIDGLKFDNGAGFAGNQFNPALASQPTGQPASLGTPLLVSVAGSRFIAAAGASYAPSNILIDQLFVRNAVQVPASTIYNAELVLQARVNNRGFAPREVGKVTLTFDGGNNLVSCDFTQSAATACEAMNCKFNSSAPSQKCVCGFPPMSCQTSPGLPQQYISGINQSTSPPTPICSNFKVDCSDTSFGGKGPGYFLSGFDQNGDPMCQPVEGGVAPPPVVCTGGATTTVSAVLASPAGCFCAATETWNGTTCVAAPICTGGATTTISAVPAAPAGCYCAASETWNGTTCAVVAGPTCTGGATTTVTAAPALPAGCFCATGQTWNGTTCVTPPASGIWVSRVGIVPSFGVIPVDNSDPVCSGAVAGAACAIPSIACGSFGAGYLYSSLGGPSGSYSPTPLPAFTIYAFLLCQTPHPNGKLAFSMACTPAAANTIIPETECAGGSIYCTSTALSGFCVPPNILTLPYTPPPVIKRCTGGFPFPAPTGAANPYNTVAGAEVCDESASGIGGSFNTGQCPMEYNQTAPALRTDPASPVGMVIIWTCNPCGAGSQPPATCL